MRIGGIFERCVFWLLMWVFFVLHFLDLSLWALFWLISSKHHIELSSHNFVKCRVLHHDVEGAFVFHFLSIYKISLLQVHQKLSIERNLDKVWRIIIDVLFLAIIRIINCRTLFIFKARFTSAILSFIFFSAEQKEVLTALSVKEVEDLIIRILIVL